MTLSSLATIWSISSSQFSPAICHSSTSFSSIGRSLHQLMAKATNSSAKRRTSHQILPTILQVPPSPIHLRSERLPMANNCHQTVEKQSERIQCQVIRIEVLPDDVLLDIFDFYMNRYPSYSQPEIEAWQSLIHVCRQWRSLVLASPRRLNLRLYCAPKTPAKDKLNIWPALPLIVEGDMAITSVTDNIIAALEQSDRVCGVSLLGLANWQLEHVLAPMQVLFPKLTVLKLRLSSPDETTPVIPDSFLGESAPHLLHLELNGIPFLGIPKLFSSAAHLVFLCLSDTPHSGYISPGAIAALLSLLSNLQMFLLHFQSPQSRPDFENLPPPNRAIIPSLNILHFKGVAEYMEELVTRIDTPQLDRLEITFFNQIDFDTPRLSQFINRTPTLGTFNDAQVRFDKYSAGVALSAESTFRTLRIAISCREPDWQVSSIEQVCNTSLYPLSTVVDLYIAHQDSRLVWKDDAIENNLWLGLLLPFTAVKNLYLSDKFAPGITAALHELIEGRTTEVFPCLQNIFVEGLEPTGPLQKKIGEFVAARQLSDHPVTISHWDKG